MELVGRSQGQLKPGSIGRLKPAIRDQGRTILEHMFI
jgi:hypothetical protein